MALGHIALISQTIRAGSSKRQSSPAAGKKMVCTQRVALPLFHCSSEICCTSGEAQAGDEDLLCFSSRACSFADWLGLPFQWLSSSRNSSPRDWLSVHAALGHARAQRNVEEGCPPPAAYSPHLPPSLTKPNWKIPRETFLIQIRSQSCQTESLRLPVSHRASGMPCSRHLC